ncbi:MAG: tetratricopeptide repeat protein, partial [Candidatus Glassbacteria bacterium]
MLPPDTENGTDRKLVEQFQWDLAKALDKSGYFDIVTQKDYENYLKIHNLAKANSIPDSILPQMMDDLQAAIYARTKFSQPGGKGTACSARVEYVFPKNDYTIPGEQLSVESEKQCEDLAKNCISVIVTASEKISAMSIARSYFNSAIYDKALENYQKLVQMEPKNINYHYMIGMCYLKLNQNDQAVAEFENIINALDPNNIQAHEALANYYFTAENFEGALKHFKKLAELKPNDYAYTQYWAFALMKLNRPDESIEVYEKLLKIRDEDPSIRHQMAYYYYSKANDLEAAGDSAAAKSTARKAVAHMLRSVELCNQAADPANPAWIKTHCDRLNLLALAQRKAEDLDGAIASLTKIIELDPSYPNASFNMGIYAQRDKKYDKAIEYYNKALKSADDSQKGTIFQQIGYISQREQSNFSQAIEAYTNALK